MNPIRTLRSMGPTLQLMSGRTIGFVVAFAIPIVLARALDPGQFGTYRLLFLIYATLLSLCQMGMAESLYYFVPQRPAVAGRWIGNAVITLAAIGAVTALLTAGIAWALRGRITNPLLVAELPKLGLFLGLMLGTLTLEIVMVCRARYRQAAFMYGASDVMRAVLLAAPALITHRLDALMDGAIVFAGIRCLVTVGYLRGTLGSDVRPDGALWRVQLRYALPFAAAVAVEIVQLNFHQYAVALWFDPATFAIYSIGCLQIPVVDLLATSAGNVMMVSMNDDAESPEVRLQLWHETVERLAFLLFPLVVLLMITAKPLIILLFTAKYAASVPIFMVSILTIVLEAFPVDSVLRVYAETRTLLLLSVLRLAIIASTIVFFVKIFYLPGAVLVTVVADAIAKVVAVGRIGRLTGARAGRVLPWGALAGTLTAAVVAAGPAWVCWTYFAAPPLAMLVTTGLIYGVSYFALISAGGLLRTATRPEPDTSGAA